MILFLSFSNVFYNVLTLISGLLVANWLLPHQLGLYSSFTILSSYIILSQIGIPMALGRNYPYFIGSNEPEKAVASVSVSHYWAILLSSITLFTGILLALFFILRKDFQTAAGLFTVSVISMEAFYVKQYLKVLYRGNHDFNKLSLINIISALVSTSSIVFVYFFGFYGLCIRAVIGTITEFILSYAWLPVRVSPRWNKENFVAELKVGFPIFLVSNVYSLWPILQRTLILFLGGTYYLGLYSLVGMVLVSMDAVTGALNSITYPTMANHWGKGSNVYQLFRSCLKPIIGVAFLFFIMLPIGWYLIPKVVDAFLPNYSPGVVAAQWMLVAGFISVFNVWTNIYNVVGHQKAKLLSFVGGIGFSLVFLWIAYSKNGMQLQIFPQSLTVAYLVILILNLAYIHKNRSITHLSVNT